MKLKRDTSSRKPLSVREENQIIRDTVTRAVSIEQSKREFTLSGRGHEPRVTLSGSMAAILRDVRIPCAITSGYGASFHYPQRVFVRADAMLLKRLGRSPINVFEGSVDRAIPLNPAPARQRPRRVADGAVLTLDLPDGSRVALDTRTFRFHSLAGPDTGSLRDVLAKAGTAKPRKSHDKIDFARLAGFLEAPHLPFAECFKTDAPGRYSPRSLHGFSVLYVTRLFEFPGTYRGGAFCPSLTEWSFLDGGIRHQRGYGSSGTWTQVQGTEVLRALCMLFGVKQPRWLKGEGRRRPLSALLEELSAAALGSEPNLGLPSPATSNSPGEGAVKDAGDRTAAGPAAS